MSDWTLAWRSFRRTPAFTLAAVATLALGIGATTAIFTVVDAALFRPLPYPDPGRLLVLTAPDARETTGQIFLHIRDRVAAFESVAAQGGGNTWNLAAGDFVTTARGLRVSERFFATHGVTPLLGREFVRAEDTPRGTDAVVIGEALWRRALGGRHDVIGQTVLLGSTPHTVVGVMPASFRSVPAVDLWTPLRTTTNDNGQNYRVIGRLASGNRDLQASADLDRLRPGIRAAFPRYSEESVARLLWMPYRTFLGSNMRQMFFILLGAVGFLLLIACVNVASLQLTRSLGRRPEMALRTALGASRWHLVRQVFVESTMLAAFGAIAGLLVAALGTRALVGLVSEQMSTQMLSGESIGLDWRVLSFTMAIALLAALLFGVAPALATSRPDLRRSIGEGAASTTMSRRTVWLRRSLVGAEVALAVVLLVGAGLLIRTLSNLTSTDPGFEARGVLVGRMSLQGAIDAAALEASVGRALEQVRARPGIVAAVSSVVPVERGLNLPLAPPQGGRLAQSRAVDWRFVTPDYFAVFDIDLRAGRMFGDTDRAGGSPVAIVNEAFARSYFGRVNVVGETIGLVPAFQDPARQIVGVVADVKARSGSGWTRGLTALGSDVAPTMFVPIGQAPSQVAGPGGQRVWDLTWSIRSATPRPDLEREIRDAVRAADGRMVFRAFEPMDAVIARDLDVPRLVASLLTSFAVLAIVLAAIGLYGLIAYSTAQRSREVGLRMALGATAGRIVRHFVSEGLSVTLAGVALGVAGAASLSRLLAILLFGVTPLDLPTFAGVLLLLLTVATLAVMIPAMRAARTNPSGVLRS